MSTPKILLQLDTDAQPSVFDAVVAVDAGVDQLLRHAAVDAKQLRDLVYGTMFTRGGEDLRNTAIFISGSDVAAGERLLEQVKSVFFGPMRVSVMLDSNGANTTAAAAVLAASRHCELKGAKALVLAATGPVGSRAVRLLAAGGAEVLAASRDQARAETVCEKVAGAVPGAKLIPIEAGSSSSLRRVLANVELIIAAGAPGVELLTTDDRQAARSLKVAIDLSAVPPLGLAGIEMPDKAKARDGVVCYGALGVGGTKMKIHKAAVQKLFSANDLVLDAAEIFEIGRQLPK